MENPTTLCYDLAKWLSHYLYFFPFLFLFSSYLDLLHKEGVWESVTWVISHNECRRAVHRLCSSCISSVQNLMETLLSSSCQLRLVVWLSHLRLSHYTSCSHLIWNNPSNPPSSLDVASSILLCNLPTVS